MESTREWRTKHQGMFHKNEMGWEKAGGKQCPSRVIEHIAKKDKKEISLNNKNVTSMKCIKRVFPLEPTDGKSETKREHKKMKIIKD